MRLHPSIITACSLAVAFGTPALAQNAAAPQDTLNDPIRIMVSRLELENYKATIKGLTQFGDRRQGTKRNRDAVDWIEAQLKSYGCTNTERLKYEYAPQQAPAAFVAAGATGAAGPPAGAGAGGRGNAAGGRGNAAG